ncbi:TetR/AcrR family transcriptional regulator [Agromyces seonyuensis]|uniref:TetR family transcriptional regulator n=1 Tax=Agromyces seonyuensis TaxID=2662446 RepID=A0A6I4NZ89_9MICO|nr:helix-turn-helix domain-containing protein [Agromyces seonyuensis]MWB97755.1 hypothetical protein [Agromyces seonyuensis]
MPDAASTSRRGRPPRVDRDRIIAAARRLDPDSITMQAVADALGVDRKTVHYHVRSRDELLALVAADAFASELAAAAAPDDDASWEGALRGFARIIHDVSLVAPLSHGIQFEPNPQDLQAILPAERAVRALLDAGLDADRISAVLRTAAIIGIGYARDETMERRHGTTVQRDGMRDYFASGDEEHTSFEALRTMTAAETWSSAAAAFDLALDLLVVGVRGLLPDTARTPAEAG